MDAKEVYLTGGKQVSSNPQFGWNAAYRSNKLPGLRCSNTNMPDLFPSGGLEGPEVELAGPNGERTINTSSEMTVNN